MRVAMLAAIALVAAGGCGGSDDDKPAYCSGRSDLESSVKGLPGAATSGDVNKLKAQITAIRGDATSLVDSAKSDFPKETSAITSSVDMLDKSVKSLSSSPSAQQIATIATDAAQVVSSVDSFVDASNSKCS